MQGYILDPNTCDISGEVLDDDGNLRVLPAAYWASVTPQERLFFAHRHAVYGLPTTELVERLTEIIAGRSAIEIGSGNGVLARALGIRGTDNHQQLMPKYREAYELSGQPRIRYGADVVPIDAAQAVRKYRPQVVVASWVTHKYDRSRHWAGGNEIGVDEEAILDRCEAYVFVGNELVHQAKKIWPLPHEIEYPSYVYSRAAMNGTRDFIAVWPGRGRDRR